MKEGEHASEEIAELDERAGASRRLVGSPASSLLDHHCACVGTCIYTHYAHHLPSSGYINHNEYLGAHSVKRAYEMQDATPAPACINAKAALLTWQRDTCQARHTFHYHHHYYHWPTSEHGRIRNGHAGPTATICCCATPHDFCSHEGPPINCPVNTNAPHRAGWASPVPATRRQFYTAYPVSSRQSKRCFTKQEAEAEKDPPEAAVCAAVEASPVTLLKGGSLPPLKHCSRPSLPPFPSLHAPPYILCARCSRLLLLPPRALLLPPPGTPLLESFLYVKLKCGFCLNLSKFSIRHLFRASSTSPAEGIFSPLLPPSPFQSMPSCITSNGGMREASKHILSETEVPINGKFEPVLDSSSVNSKGIINGYTEHNSEHEHPEAPAAFIGLCKDVSNHNHFHTSEPASDTHGDSMRSKANASGALGYGKGLHTDKTVIEIGESLNGTFGNLAQSKHAETGALLNKCVYTPEIGHETKELNGMCGDLTQSLHVESGALLNGKHAETEEIGIKTAENANGICEDEAQPMHAEAGAPVSGNCGQTSKDKDNEAGLNSIGTDTSDQKKLEQGVCDNGVVYDNQVTHLSHSDKEQEITAYSSVQEWVDSLSAEIGYESDGQFQTPLNSLSKFANESDNIISEESFRHRSPLHRHLGYSTPSELFEKVLFSEDEEIKARTETSSTASSSFSSMNACQRSGTKSSCIHVHTPSLRSWDVSADHSGVIGSNGQDGQKSLAGLLKKSLKVGSLLPVTPKSRVVVNGHTLSNAVVKQAEERAGKLRPGFYWYDCKAGFWGVEGGPCLGILPPCIEELNYAMAKQCSNGDTQVYINGRELHAKDLAVLSQRGLSRKTGRAYTLGFDGVLVDETTGLEVKQLGKLAPTVERRGKGFGMFTAADALQQSKAPAVHHQIKPAN